MTTVPKVLCVVTVAVALGHTASRADAAPLAFVTTPRTSSLSVIDTDTNSLRAPIPLEGKAYRVGVSPCGDRVFVLGLESEVWVIDTASLTVITTLSGVRAPVRVAVAPSGERAYITCGGGFVAVVDVATNSIVDRITVGEAPVGIAVSNDGRRLYVANTFDSDEHSRCIGDPLCDLKVSVVDTSLGKEIRRILIGPRIRELALNPSGTRLYVTGETTLAVIDTASFAVIERIPQSVRSLAVDRTSRRIFATTHSRLLVVDRLTNLVTAEAALGDLRDIAVTPDGLRLYAVGPPDSAVSVIDTASLQITDTIDVPGPVAIAIAPAFSETPCPGDCDSSGTVTIDEVLALVNIALGSAPIGDCAAGDRNGDGQITVDEIITAVNAALTGCLTQPSPTPTPTPPPPTPTPCDTGTPCPPSDSKICLTQNRCICFCEGPTRTSTPTHPLPSATEDPCIQGGPPCGGSRCGSVCDDGSFSGSCIQRERCECVIHGCRSTPTPTAPLATP